MNRQDLAKAIERSLDALERWVEDHGYCGYEPFDGLSSFLRPLTRGNVFLERLLQQTIRQSPVNLRPLLGVKPLESTKGRGYMGWGFLDRYRLSHSDIYKRKTLDSLDWLKEHKSPLYPQYSWGNSFPYASRSLRIGVDEPTIVWTSLIGQVFLEAYETFGREEDLDVIESITRWTLDLPVEPTPRGLCLSYVAFQQKSIHNSNMLGAAFLAGAARHIENVRALEVAKEAMLYSCSRQLPDGGWYYGEDRANQWIDNFHTGYNLCSLKWYISASGDSDFDENLSRGLRYYTNAFFEEDGRPRYYHNRTYPVDIQCASQSIDTLALFSDDVPECLGLACRVAEWTINNMQDKDGHFHYRIYPGGIRAKMPMMHWGQATTYKALARLLAIIGMKRSPLSVRPTEQAKV